MSDIECSNTNSTTMGPSLHQCSQSSTITLACLLANTNKFTSNCSNTKIRGMIKTYINKGQFEKIILPPCAVTEVSV